MKFKVKGLDFYRALRAIYSAVDKKATIPILGNVLIELTVDGLFLSATDLELWIQQKCPAESMGGGITTVPYKPLLDFVKTVKKHEITCSLEGESFVVAYGEGSSVSFDALAPDAFPEMPGSSEDAEVTHVLDTNAEKLRRVVGHVEHCVAQEPTRFTIDGFLIRLKGKSATFAATDGHRMGVHTIRMPAAKRNFNALVPTSAAKQILGIKGEEEVRISVDESNIFIHYKDTGRFIIAHKLSGTFPNYEYVLPKDKQYPCRVSAESLKRALLAALPFTNKRTPCVEFHFEGNKLSLSAANSDDEERKFQTVLPVEYESICDGEYLDTFFGLNATYLLAYLKGLGKNADTIEFRLKGHDCTVELRYDKEPSYRYIVMPIKVDKSKTVKVKYRSPEETPAPSSEAPEEQAQPQETKGESMPEETTETIEETEEEVNQQVADELDEDAEAPPELVEKLEALTESIEKMKQMLSV